MFDSANDDVVKKSDVINHVNSKFDDSSLLDITREIFDFHQHKTYGNIKDKDPLNLRNAVSSSEAPMNRASRSRPRQTEEEEDHGLLGEIYDMFKSEAHKIKSAFDHLLARHHHDDDEKDQVDKPNLAHIKEKVTQLMENGKNFASAQWNVILNFLKAWATPLEALWNSLTSVSANHRNQDKDKKSLISSVWELAKKILKAVCKGTAEIAFMIKDLVQNIIEALQIVATFRKIIRMIQSSGDALDDFYSSALGPVIEFIAKNIDYSRESSVKAEFQSIIAENVEHPRDHDELRDIIINAKGDEIHPSRTVRVKGSGHSFPAEIYLPKAGNRPPVFVELDDEYWQRLLSIEPNDEENDENDENENNNNNKNNNNNQIHPREKKIDGKTLRTANVTVRAGIHIGTNHNIPKSDFPIEITDKNGYQTMINNRQLGTLNVLLWKQGWTLPDVGGIDHQTVGGFLSTGSAGGSAINDGYDLGSHIMSIQFIDGRGETHRLHRDDFEDPDENPFFAVGISMGLYGIITEVTFRVVENFALYGNQVTANTNETKTLGIDFFSEDPEPEEGVVNTAEYLKTQDYGRILWWPQPGVNKLTVWNGNRFFPKGAIESKDYVEVGSDVTASTGRSALQKAGAALLKAGDMVPMVMCYGANIGLPSPLPRLLMNQAVKAYAKLLNSLFVPDDNYSFQDYAFKSIPMDNGIDDELLKVEFTELWLDIKDTATALDLLRTEYEENGFEATGNFNVEIYASASSNFWLSPAYKKDVIRLDWFWFGHNSGDPVSTGFFPRFWRLMKNFNYRPHWGKWLPRRGEYKPYDELYPKMKQWKELRQHYDPNDIFLTDYWSYHLDIKPNDRMIQTPKPKRTFDTTTLFERMAAEYNVTKHTLMDHVRHPDSRNDIAQIMQKALDGDLTLGAGDQPIKNIRAIGTKYSYGRVGYVDPKFSLLLDTSRHLNSIVHGPQITDHARDCFLDHVELDNICYCEAGATLEMVNNYLWPPEYRELGRAGKTVFHDDGREHYQPFKMMNAVIGYSQLSTVGTILVGAHGTGANTPPLADSVRSMEIITVDGNKVKRLIVEPESRPLTDPQKFNQRQEKEKDQEHYLETELIQDNQVFYTAVVSTGAMGIVYSVIFDVQDAFYVDTEIVSFELSKDASPLKDAINDSILDNNLGVILFQNPYGARSGVMRVFKKHKEKPEKKDQETHNGVKYDKLNYQTAVPFNFDNTLIQFLTDFMVSSARSSPEQSTQLVPEFLKLFSQLLNWPPQARQSVMDAPTAFDLGAPAAMKVNVSEVAKGFKNGEEAVKILNEVCDSVEEKRIRTPSEDGGNPAQEIGWLTAPLIVELVGESKAYMTESYDSRYTLTMEMPGFWEYEETNPVQEAVMNEMWQKKYRIHFGENIFHVTHPSRYRNLGTSVRDVYRGYDTWASVMKRFSSQSHGLFLNEFARELVDYQSGATEQ